MSTSSDDSDVWPRELVLDREKRNLRIDFGDGAVYALPAEYLRVETPSAEAKGHSPAERRIVAGKRNVAIRAVEPVGHYAVRLIFDDGHSTGIYSWPYLHELGRDRAKKWQAYLDELGGKGLSRDP